MPSQRVFNAVYIRVNFATGHELQWSLNPGFNDILPYSFTVEASTTFDFSEIVWTINVGDNFFAIDNSNIKQNWSKDLLYRVKLTTGSGSNYYSETISFDSAPTTKRKYRMASEIMRKNTVWFKFAGFQGYLLKRKTYGQIDVPNVDPITGIPLNDNIGGFGTGIVGGYYNPIPVAFIVESNARARAQSPDGEGVKELYDLVVRTQGFPYIDTRDIIVKAETGQRFNVDDSESVYFPGTQIQLMQKLSLKLLPTSDTIYQIEVPSYQVPQLPLDQQPGV